MTDRMPIMPVSVGPPVTGRYGQNRYQRYAALGRFLAKLPDEAPFWACWPMATARSDGYARYGSGTYFDGEIYAHRIAWRLANGWAEIPEGHEIDHLCFNPPCVNPLHLRCVPLLDNRYQRPRPLATLCPRGHPYSGGNLYVNPKTGQRACRECTRAALRRSHAKHRAKRNAERAAYRQRVAS